MPTMVKQKAEKQVSDGHPNPYEDTKMMFPIVDAVPASGRRTTDLPKGHST